jgi:flavin reductase (DIM6/NTAB) family NADH-FMN oxidoreductase RutF
MAVTTADFRAALRQFPTGVTVVTTCEDDGSPAGLTANAFTSVSLDPPLVLVCIDRAATAHPALVARGWFAVNVLAKGQEHLSRRFATSGEDKFAGVAFHTGGGGLPLLEGVVAVLECRVVYRYDGGDHTIFVGLVEHAGVNGGQPLVYHGGRYHHL